MILIIGIICDSANDISKEFIDKYNIKVAPIHIKIGDEEFRDGDKGCMEKLREYMKHSYAQTTQASFHDVKNLMNELINQGCKEIIGLTMSNQVSGTNNVFQLVSKELMKENEDVRIEIIDTLNISMGAGVLTLKAAQLRDVGKNFDEITEQIRSMVSRNSRIMFVVPTLKYLVRGGRIGKITGSIVEALNIKPVASINKEGIIYTYLKARGINNAVKKMIKEIEAEVDKGNIEALAIAYSGNMENTMKNVEKIRNSFKDTINTIYVGEINATLWCYAGIGLVGVAILTKYTE